MTLTPDADVNEARAGNADDVIDEARCPCGSEAGDLPETHKSPPASPSQIFGTGSLDGSDGYFAQTPSAGNSPCLHATAMYPSLSLDASMLDFGAWAGTMQAIMPDFSLGCCFQESEQPFSAETVVDSESMPPLPEQSSAASVAFAENSLAEIQPAEPAFPILENAASLDYADISFDTVVYDPVLEDYVPCGWMMLASTEDHWSDNAVVGSSDALCTRLLDALLEGANVGKKREIEDEEQEVRRRADAANHPDTGCSSAIDTWHMEPYIESWAEAFPMQGEHGFTASCKQERRDNHIEGSSVSTRPGSDGSLDDQDWVHGSASEEEACHGSQSWGSRSRRHGEGRSMVPQKAGAGRTVAKKMQHNQNPDGTTMMLRNIPNKYTREMLVDVLNQELRGLFDFLYLPIDFQNSCNMGYGFVNFRTIQARDIFVKKFDGVDVCKCLPGLNSHKVVEVVPARYHGLDQNVKRMRSGAVMEALVDHPEWMPMVFDEEGNELPFPMGGPEEVARRAKESEWSQSSRSGKAKRSGGKGFQRRTNSALAA